MPVPPPRRESFHFLPTATNPPDYSSLAPLADGFSAGTLTLSQNETKALVRESYTLSSAAAYSSYSETSANWVQQASEASTQSSVTSNSQSPERKVSSVKLTPITIPDPPVHCNSYLDPDVKVATPPPPTAPSPQTTHNTDPPSLTKTTSLSVHLGLDNLKQPEGSSISAKAKVPNRAAAQSHLEVPAAPPAVPPRPSPAELLVNKWQESKWTHWHSRLNVLCLRLMGCCVIWSHP